MDAIDCRWRQAFDLKLAPSELAERLHTLIGSKSIHQQPWKNSRKALNFGWTRLFLIYYLTCTKVLSNLEIRTPYIGTVLRPRVLPTT